MNLNFSEWYRSVKLEPNDTILKNRWSGIENYTENLTDYTNVLELVRLFYNLPVSENFRDEFCNVFIETDSAFSKNNSFELSVLAGASLVNIIEEGGGLKIFRFLQ
ncbi:hypothetical protein MFMK1_001154 [Metallumcola ferriviriculae]|uniref:Uncharacterized protein n=1 Tax=Metallumcola ferriviriculae TaxID=3039180 RepID=A0AAU0UM87_9FIRM|nr:hypothetical protein MFMK1_001154 [Desulfitibacteraceae bacterium MK1]